MRNTTEENLKSEAGPRQSFFIERCLLAFIVVLSSGAIMHFLFGAPVSKTLGAPRPGYFSGLLGDYSNFATEFLYVVVGVVLTLRLVSRNAMRGAIRGFRRNVILVSFFALALLSSQWSFSPLGSVKRSLALLLLMYFAVVFSESFSMKEQRRIVGLTLFGIVAASLVFELGRRFTGMGAYSMRWCGLFTQKNGFGWAAGLGLLCFLPGSWAPRESGGFTLKVRALAIFVFAVAIVLSGSVGAIVAVACSFLVFMSSQLLRSDKPAWCYPVGGLAILTELGGGLAVAVWPSGILQWLGRDATLTGRTELWSGLLDCLSRRPFLGLGYASFWTPHENPFLHEIWQSTGYVLFSAHNGYLEVALGCGIVGLVLLAVFLMCYFLRAQRYFWVFSDRAAAAWPISVLAFMVVGNAVHSMFFEFNEVRWFFFLLVFVQLKGAMSDYE